MVCNQIQDWFLFNLHFQFYLLLTRAFNYEWCKVTLGSTASNTFTCRAKQASGCHPLWKWVCFPQESPSIRKAGSAEQSRGYSELCSLPILAGSVCLSPAGCCSQAGWAPRVPAAGSGSVGDTRVVPAPVSTGLNTHAAHPRTGSSAVLCLWLRMVVILEFASINPQQWGMKRAVLYSACTCCLMLYGVIRLWFALQYSVLEFGL